MVTPANIFCMLLRVFPAVGRHWSNPRFLPDYEGGGAAVAPDGGEAVPQPAGRELKPGHAGGRRWVSAEPLCWKLEGVTHLPLTLEKAKPSI